jgi:hypothetical protein
LPRHHRLLRARLGCDAPHRAHPSLPPLPFWSAPSLARERLKALQANASQPRKPAVDRGTSCRNKPVRLARDASSRSNP